MSHNADCWSSRNLAISLNTWMTFSRTNLLQDYCKKWRASTLHAKLGYLRHILIFMTFWINEDAANHQESVLGHVRSFRSYIKWKPDSYICHNVYRILLLPVSECRLKFNLISMSHIWAYPLSTRPMLVKMNYEKQGKTKTKTSSARG